MNTLICRLRTKRHVSTTLRSTCRGMSRSLRDISSFTGGKRGSSGHAQARAKRAQDYLVKVRGIDSSRIVTIDGGRRDRLEVELYALPISMSPPTPNHIARNSRELSRPCLCSGRVAVHRAGIVRHGLPVVGEIRERPVSLRPP
jgi:hypothetical protein